MKITSKYLKAFETFGPKAQELSTFFGNKIFIEKIDDAELLKTAGGLIIATDDRSYKSAFVMNKCAIGVVLMAGGGTYDPDGEEHLPVEHTPGTVVLYTPNGLMALSTFPGFQGSTNDKVGILHGSDVLFSWNSMAAFNEYAAGLAAALAGGAA